MKNFQTINKKDINRIGLGGIPIQKLTKEEAKQVILYAYQKGVNFIDTARGYTCSEEYIGYATKDIRNSIFLATKSMARTKEAMEQDIEISLNNLNTNYIDLYQAHNISKEEDYMKFISENGAYQTLKNVKASGKIRYIGITSHSYDMLLKILTTEEYKKFDSIQFPYNFIEKEAEKLFQIAQEKNIKTIAMKPLGGGYITNGKIALKYILNNNNLSVAIPGIKDIKEIDENLSVTDYTISQKEQEYIDNIVDSVKGEFCHRCGYCLPCTKQIDIPSIFTLENYLDRYNLNAWAQTRYNNMKVKASACIECKKCMTKCPYSINIIERLKRIRDKFEV